MKKYPNREDTTIGPALTNIENVRPETLSVFKQPVDPKKLQFDLKEVWKQKLPWTPSDE